MNVKALKRLIVEASGKGSTSMITIGNHQRTRRINLRLLKRITNALLADLKIGDAVVGVHLVATPEMTRLNETFLAHQGATDVITFDYVKCGEARFGRRRKNQDSTHGTLALQNCTVKFSSAWTKQFHRHASFARAGNRKSRVISFTAFCICSVMMIRVPVCGRK